MRSGEHALFEAHLATSRVRAERAAWLAAAARSMGAMMRANARMGITFREAAAGMRKFAAALEASQRRR